MQDPSASTIITLRGSECQHGEVQVTKETIGFVGVGRMGQPMASRLMAAGYPGRRL